MICKKPFIKQRKAGLLTDVGNIASPCSGHSSLYRQSASALTRFNVRLFFTTFLLFLPRSPCLGLRLNHLPHFFSRFSLCFSSAGAGSCRVSHSHVSNAFSAVVDLDPCPRALTPSSAALASLSPTDSLCCQINSLFNIKSVVGCAGHGF